MVSERLPGQTLRATLREIERGLFSVSYRIGTMAWDGGDLPRYQIGTSAGDAEQKIEAKAREIGFETVNWDYAIGATAGFLPSTETIILAPKGAPQAAHG